MLSVPQHIWEGLVPDHRRLLGERYIVNVLDGKNYGQIIDAQILNESTAGSNAGSRLGERVASAAYVDNAFSGGPRNWNYSASGHLAAQLLGAAVGSAANQQAVARFRTRYTIKTGSGSVEYVEEIRSDALRHTVGLCVTTRPIKPIDFDTCNQTRDQFLAKYAAVLPLGNGIQTNSSASSIPPHPPYPPPPPPANTYTSQSVSSKPVAEVKKQAQSAGTQAGLDPTPETLIQCKIGVASPIRVSVTVCESAGGIVYPQ